MKQSHPGHMPIKREILYGRTLEGLGRKAEALKVYEGLAGNPRLDGEEARCRLAQLLEAGGDCQRAGAIYAEILKRSKGFSRPFRRAQQEWISAARAGLRRTRSG